MIRAVNSADDPAVRSLLDSARLPLAGLEDARLWVLPGARRKAFM